MPKEYFVTKLSFREDVDLIRDVYAYEYDGYSITDRGVQPRQWLVNRTEADSQISVMTRNEEGHWIRGNLFTYSDGLFSWRTTLPKNIMRRKTFVSYYHYDDQDYRDRFENLFGDLVISKSVEDGDIDCDNCADYIKQLIQQQYLADASLLVVLIGARTKCRKHVDWEISGVLNFKVGDNYSGVLGLFLPAHLDFGSQNYSPDSVPKRLSANFNSGYAIARDWTDDRPTMQKYLEIAFKTRKEKAKIVNLSIPQMQRNISD